MATKKFSQFDVRTSIGTSNLVGFDGADNVKLDQSALEASLNLSNLQGNVSLASQVSGTLPLANGGTGQSAITSTGIPLVGYLMDESTQVIGDSLIIEDNGGGGSVLGTGAAVNINPPAVQLKIAGTSGISNTNDSTDFMVPYNSTIVNTDTSIFSPTITGGLGAQGSIRVSVAGRYLLQARYSTYDLVQNYSGSNNVDGRKFLRITAAVNGSKVCVLHNLVVATTGNGEAVASGSGIMDLEAEDLVSIIGFHTGATGGSGTQGYPVSNNTLFNEPMFWLVKIG